MNSAAKIDDREEDVRQRPGGDHGDALPRLLPPVRVRRRASRRAPAARGSCRARASSAGSCARAVVLVAALERRVEHVERLASTRLLLLGLAGSCAGRRPPAGTCRGSSRSRRAGTRRCRTRRRCARRLDERRAEAEVELPRPHPDRARDEEVPRLVDEDQDGEADDRGGDAHQATGTRSRARRSASTSSSRSRAGAPSTRASTSSTSEAISRKPIRPLEERLHGDLVRGVVDAGIRAAALAGLAARARACGTSRCRARGTRACAARAAAPAWRRAPDR